MPSGKSLKRREPTWSYYRKVMTAVATERKKIKILLVDDHETVREGLKSILSTHNDLDVVDEATDGESAVNRTRTIRPDVVVMDVSMPGLNGLRATHAIKQSCPHTQ